MDPQDESSCEALKGLTYNRVVEALVALNNVAPEEPTPGPIPSSEKPTPPPTGPIPSSRPIVVDAKVMRPGDDPGVTLPAIPLHVQIDPGGCKPVGIECHNEKTPPTCPREENDRAKGRVIKKFMECTANQLTYHGLVLLHQHLRERQLSVFFRNNHFSTMLKFNSKLFLLVTDVGYRDEKSVVWELLDGIDGDTEYVDSSFSSTMALDHLDPDYLLALQMQSDREPPPHRIHSATAVPVLDDHVASPSVPIVKPIPHSRDVKIVRGSTEAVMSTISDGKTARELQPNLDCEPRVIKIYEPQSEGAAPASAAQGNELSDEMIALMLHEEFEREDVFDAAHRARLDEASQRRAGLVSSDTLENKGRGCNLM